MPRNALAPSARREMVERALKGENRRRLAEEYGVTQDAVYRAIREAKRDVPEMLAHWRRVADILGGEAED